MLYRENDCNSSNGIIQSLPRTQFKICLLWIEISCEWQAWNKKVRKLESYLLDMPLLNVNCEDMA